jgi:hypothetical protein
MDVGSDHHLVIGKIKLKIAATIKLNQSRRRRFDITNLTDPKIVESFKFELRNCFQLLEKDYLEKEELVDINTKYNKIRDELNETNKNVLGYKDDKRKEWITEKIWNNILERWNFKAKINTSRTRKEKNSANKEYQSKNKEVKRMICNYKRKFIEHLADKAQ